MRRRSILVALSGTVLLGLVALLAPKTSQSKKEVRIGEGKNSASSEASRLSPEQPPQSPISIRPVESNHLRLVFSSELEAMLDQLVQLERKAMEGNPTKDEMIELYKRKERFSILAWSSPTNILYVLDLATRHKEDSSFLFVIEGALMHISDGKTLRSRTPLGSELAQSMAAMFLQVETSTALRRIHLGILKSDANQELERNALRRHEMQRHLSLPAISKIIEAAILMADDVAIGDALFLAGQYSDLYREVASALERLILDPSASRTIRLAALDNYRTEGLSQHRFALAREILEREQDPSFRKAAIKLLSAPSQPESDDSVKLAALGILVGIAGLDSDPNIRAQAADSLINTISDPGAFSTIERLVIQEQNPKVRAGILYSLSAAYSGNRQMNYAAQSLALHVFEMDSDGEVRRAAVCSYLGLMKWTIITEEQMVDLHTVGTVQRMAAAFIKRPPDIETKVEIKRRLQEQFENNYPDLLRSEEYLSLKRLLDE